MAAPKANAFIGESLVVNPVTKDLTSAAKTIIEKPTFIAENVGEAAAAGGEVEAGGAASVFEGSLLPVLAPAVLALGAGVGIGSLICHVSGIEGCLWFSSSGSQTIEVKPGRWEFFENPLGFSLGWYDFTSYGTTYKDSYWWHYSTSFGQDFAELPKGGPAAGEWEAHKCTTETAMPPGASIFLRSSVEFTCPPNVKPEGAVKSVMRGRKLEHISEAEGAALKAGGKVETEPSFSRPGKATENIAKAIEGHSGDARAHVGEKIASKIEGSGVENPYAKVTVPSCVGLTAAACLKVLEELGLTPSVANLSYLEANIPSPNLDEPILSLEAQAEKVQKLAPTTGVKVVAGSKVTVTANPKLAGMPIIVPDDPAPGESAEAWKAKRVSPQTGKEMTVNEDVLGETFTNPHYNPDAVVRPVPEPGTRLDPSTSHEIDVKVNPSDAPVPSVGPFTPPALHSVNLGPLTGIHLGCGIFPFGAFCWFGEALTNFGAEGGCPSMYLPVGSVVGKEWKVGVDFCEYETPMEVWRLVFIFFATLGVVMAFAMRSMDLGSGVSDD